MQRQMKLDLKNHFKVQELNGEMDELVDSVEKDVSQNPKISFRSENRRVWMKNEYPDYVKRLDLDIRDYFDIPEDTKMTFSLFYPPDTISKEQFTIKDGNSKIMSRIIVSTTDEYTDITFGKVKGDNLYLKKWYAYQSPPIVGGMLAYTFSNDKNVIQKVQNKGHRAGCSCILCRKGGIPKKKNPLERYILLFDYLVGDKDMRDLENMFEENRINRERAEKVAKLLDDI